MHRPSSQHRVLWRGLLGLSLLGAAAALVLIRPSATAPPAEEPTDPPAEPAPAALGTEPERPEVSPHQERVVQLDWFAGTAQDESADRELDLRGRPAYRGQLIWRDSKKPIAGVPLRLTRAWLDTVVPDRFEVTQRFADGEPLQLAFATETDALGRFTLPFVASGGDLFLRIDPRGAAEDLRMLPRPVVPGQTVELGALAIDARGEVTGTVILADASGRARRPLTRARVRIVDLPLDSPTLADQDRAVRWHGAQQAHPARKQVAPWGIAELPRWRWERDRLLPFPETTTGAGGSFSLVGLRPGRALLVVQTADLDMSREIVVQSGRTNHLGELALNLPKTVPLRLLDSDGRAADADVALVRVPPQHRRGRRPDALETSTMVPEPRRSVDGVVHVPASLIEADSLGVYVRRHPSWPWETYRPQRNGNRWLVRFQQLREASVRVVDAQANAIDDATISVHPALIEGRGPTRALTRAVRGQRDGAWELMPLPPGEYRVFAHKPGFITGVRRLRIHRDGTSRISVRLEEPLPNTTIRVFTRSGERVAGANVHVKAERTFSADRQTVGDWHLRRSTPIPLGRTDSEGDLVVAGLWRCKFTFSATHPDRGTASRTVAITHDGDTVNLALEPTPDPGRIDGQLTEAGEMPITRWWVRAWRRARGRLDIRTVRTDDAGRFVIDDLSPGDWTLSVFSRPEPPQGGFGLRSRVPSRKVLVASNETRHIDYEVVTNPRHIVRGRVLLNGLAVDDLTVTVERIYEEDERPERWDPPFRATARLAPSGRFIARVGSRGTMQLRVARHSRGSLRTLAIRRLEDGRDPNDALEFDLAVGSADLQVFSDDGRRVIDQVLRARLLDSDPEIAYDAVSDAQGQVFFEDIPAGDYELTGAGTTQPARFPVIAGQITPRGVTFARN